MRQRIPILVVTVAAMVWASAAWGAPLKWEGTSVFRLGSAQPTILTGTGVATVNNSSGLGHLSVLRFDGLDGTGINPVTDPETTQVDGIVAIEFVVPPTGTGTLGSTANPISGGPSFQGTLPVRGFSRICLLSTACNPGGFIQLDFTEHTTGTGTIGFGVGGLLTVGQGGAIRISVQANPWTLGQATALDQTDNLAIITKTVTGFAHGPASLTSSTAAPSGVVQFVTPLQVSTNLTAGSSAVLSLLGKLRIHFVPEPGLLLLVGSGVAALVLLGRSRMR